MNLGLWHLHIRRRTTKQLEPYPATNRARRNFDYIMYGVGLIQPLALLPQITAIYIHHEKAGVSIETWALLTVFNTLWAVYGIVHKDKPIAIANILLTVLDLTIVLGVLYYH